MEIVKKTILVIEDEEAYQKALFHKLALEGYSVVDSRNGEDGLQSALRIHPDLILLDLMMPKLGGVEVLKGLQKDVWGKTAKVIVLTNINDVKKIAEVMAEGTYDYFVKADVKIEELVARIKSKILEP